MKVAALLAGLAVCVAGAVSAAPSEPARGSALRADVLGAVRVMVGYDLLGPIEFVVDSLAVEGDLALAMLTAQRPGGGRINLRSAPLVLRDGVPADLIDGTSVVAFLRRSGKHWYVIDYSVGATDVWWAGGPYCDDYAAFLPIGAC